MSTHGFRSHGSSELCRPSFFRFRFLVPNLQGNVSSAFREIFDGRRPDRSRSTSKETPMFCGQVTPRPYSPFRLIVRLALAWAIIGPGLGVRASAADFMYVSLDNSTIVRYDVSLATGTDIQNSANVFVPSGRGLNFPIGLAFDKAGNLYAANSNGDTITRYDTSGNQIGTDFVPTGQGLNSPRGLAFDTVGNLYVSNGFGNTITRYDTSGNRIGTDFVPTGQGLSSPAGLAFDAAGNLYASNIGNNTITRYDSSGNRIGTDFVATGEGLNGPYGIAFDTSGNLYAANHLGNTITRYDSSGNRIGTDFVPTGQGLVNPVGLAFDKSGNLYAANLNNNTISKYNSAGVFQFSWSTPVSPRFLAFVPEPSTYVLGGLATALMAVIARRRRQA
ncbi:PEP-CTERM sorting domain-containing protein [bacterium]|nr:PEP-CTERM sorting domain-containing protein [bacterium]